MTIINLGSLGSRGIRFVGPETYAEFGRAVIGAGDVNGDGIDDFVVSTLYSAAGYGPGGTFILFGKVGGLGPLNLSTLSPADGYFVQDADDTRVMTVGGEPRAAGDFNGDGLGDLLIASPGYNSNVGRVFLLYGSPAGFGSIDLDALDADDGATITGASAYYYTGGLVESAGDLNNDGNDDFLIGTSANLAYVLFGKSGGLGDINLAALSAADGFTIQGPGSGDVGHDGGSAGDFNGDGFDDLILTSPGTGKAYIVFGKSSGLTNLNLGSLPASRGFILQNSVGGGITDASTSAGDVNGDGFDDIIVKRGDSEATVVSGRSGGPQTIDIGNLGSSGFAISGTSIFFSVSTAGDFNGDGFDDLILGGPLDGSQKGRAYVIFGKTGGFGPIDVSNLADADGFVLEGKTTGDRAGYDVSSAGDVNGDGFDDIIVGAFANADGGVNAGAAYIVYGVAPTNAVTRTGSAGDQTIHGGAFADSLDGAGGADTLVGGAGNDTYFVDNVNDRIVEAVNGGSDLVKSSVSHVMDAEVEDLELTGAASINATGNALANEIFGNASANILAGGAGADRLYGGDGDDALDGGDDDDFLSSGSGIDALNGGAGDNALYFGAYFGASDVAAAGAGLSDKLILQGDYSAGLALSFANVGGIDEVHFLGHNVMDYGGNDSFGNFSARVVISNSAVQPGQFLIVDGQLLGSPLVGSYETLWVDGSDLTTGRLYLLGGFGDDTLIGGAQNDFLYGNDGSDTMRGGQGDDYYYEVDAADMVVENAGEGTDRVFTYLANYSLAGTYIENLTGGTANQTLIGNQFANVIDGGAGADTMRGGLGNDTYYVDNVGDQVEETAGAGAADEVATQLASYVLGANIESLRGLESINQILTGNALANRLDGGAGLDRLYGGAGNDTYIIDNLGDRVFETNAADGRDLVLSSVTFVLGAHVENLTLTGAGAANGAGNTLDNVLIGNDGANILDGGAGADIMTGGAGDDTFVIDNVSDRAIETAADGGSDTVRSAISYTIGANLENLTLTGTDAINATGNTGANFLTGNTGSNSLNGGTGADQMRGGAGDDVYFVDNAGDLVEELSASHGVDRVHSSVGFTLGSYVENLTLTGSAVIDGTGNTLANTIVGNSAANLLSGLSGNDSLQGAGGGDTLDGGAGNDTLQGGAGLDRFIFANALNATTNVDHILDFVHGQDKIVLENGIFTTLGAGALLANAFVLGTTAADADDRIIYDAATGALYYDRDGTGAAAQVQFATLDNLPLNFGASDFLVI